MQRVHSARALLLLPHREQLLCNRCHRWSSGHRQTSDSKTVRAEGSRARSSTAHANTDARFLSTLTK